MGLTPTDARSYGRRVTKRAPKPIKRCIYLDRSVLAEIRRLADANMRTISSEGLWLITLGFHVRDKMPDLPEPFLDEGLATAYLYLPPPMSKEIMRMARTLNRRGKAKLRTRVAGYRGKDGEPPWSISCVIRYLLEAGLHVEHWIEGLLSRNTALRAVRAAPGSPRACALALIYDHTAEELAGMAERKPSAEFLRRWNIEAEDADAAVRVAFDARLQLEELVDVPPPADGDGAEEEEEGEG